MTHGHSWEQLQAWPVDLSCPTALSLQTCLLIAWLGPWECGLRLLEKIQTEAWLLYSSPPPLVLDCFFWDLGSPLGSGALLWWGWVLECAAVIGGWGIVFSWSQKLRAELENEPGGAWANLSLSLILLTDCGPYARFRLWPAISLNLFFFSFSRTEHLGYYISDEDFYGPIFFM